MSTDAVKSEARKPYSSPELQEWGSIRDLTHGGTTFGKNDFPKKGGSLPA